MNIWVGTSGYNYPEWRGTFYPPKLAAAKMLPFYAEHFSTVEINNTFYRMPNEKVLGDWSAATPDTFKLTLKAPKRITHDARLRDCGDAARYFFDTAAKLGPKLGVLLFQLPPYFRRDLEVLDEFLALFPDGVRAAFEFRHASWFDEEVYARLRQHSVALCIMDDEGGSTPAVMTASYAYFRLRDEGYATADLERWAATIRSSAASCNDVFVYFKHEAAGKGPQFARALLDVFALDVFAKTPSNG
jgi:uncharacterized protein YecE (DUF72 family)